MHIKIWQIDQEIGFSTRAIIKVLIEVEYLQKIYTTINDSDRESQLYQFRNAGKKVVQEILLKMTILIDFYDKKE